MEAGKTAGTHDREGIPLADRAIDLIDPMVAAGNRSVTDGELLELERSACPTCGSCSGMFTANSMNCSTEALGLALPGNGTLLATHALRWQLFEQAGRLIVDLARRHYVEGDDSILPRNIANAQAMTNAMTLDIAMAGSTNTILHLLAAAEEGGVPFGLPEIDDLSRRVPNICKVAPSSAFHVEDVGRAGGIFTILGALDRAGLIDREPRTVHSATLGEAIDSNDIRVPSADAFARQRALSAPGGIRTIEAFSQDTYFEEPDQDAEQGCIREVSRAYSPDGGLAMLYGNLAPDGSVVKTAGVDSSILTFEGKARVYESQDDACQAILSDKVAPGDVVVIRYEGPKGGPGMQEMLYPTSYLKAKALGAQCALVTGDRFSGGSSGLVIGHISPEGGAIGLVEEGDRIRIDIPERRIDIEISEAELERRRESMESRGEAAWRPTGRNRIVSQALQAYALLTTSASRGAVRDVRQVESTKRAKPPVGAQTL